MARTPLDVEVTYARILRLLRAAIRDSGRPQMEVDEAIGRHRGHLDHVFHRRTELKVRELLKVLGALRLDPAQFLGPLVVGSRPGRRPRTPEELLAQLAERVAAPVETLYDEEVEPEAVEEAPRQVPPELRALVESYLDQFLAQPRRVGEEGEREEAGTGSGVAEGGESGGGQGWKKGEGDSSQEPEPSQ